MNINADTIPSVSLRRQMILLVSCVIRLVIYKYVCIL
jgi:hypothetical protein